MLVDLDKVVPEDITFQYRGREYVLDGDLATEDVLRLAQLLDQAQTAETAGDLDAVQKLNPKIKQELLKLFQRKDPTLEGLPFGAIAYQHVIAAVLELMGFVLVEEDPPTPTPEKPNRAQRRRSTGSRP